jgi:glycosyltransferase involved in cell wall biosynthesis
MGHPIVSVLMNCLNGARYLREALDSVFAQTYTNWEVIFWDDASTDDSVAIATSYGRKVRVFHGLGGMPLGYSRTCGLRKARGTSLAILDCDDWWTPTHLDTLTTIWPQDRGIQHTLLTAPNPLRSSALMFYTHLVRRHGGWNPTLRYAETYDLCLRLSHYRYGIGHSPRTAHIRSHPTQACGRGHAAVTKEVLTIMRFHRGQAGWRQVLREGLLWGKYGLQRYAHL